MSLNPLEGFWANAKAIGFTPRRCLLIVLAVLGAWLLHGGISAWVVLGFVVLIYLFEPLETLVRMLVANRRAGPSVARDRREHETYLGEHRRRLDERQPPLPLEPPRDETGGN